MFKTILSLALALTLAAPAMAQKSEAKKKPQKWTSWASKQKDQYFTTADARRVGDNVLLYQHASGGWPKNVYMQVELDSAQRAKVIASKQGYGVSTIDNKATTTEITFLARLYNATGEKRYLDGALRGIEYLFEAQYDNGGWPQFYPVRRGYYTHITYNDDAMINVLKLVRDVSKAKAPFTFVADSTKAKAAASLDRGVDCIVKTQVVRNGVPTVWCAQYDEQTLQPAKARAYELISLSGQESDDIVLFLMSLSKPRPEVVSAVEGAVEWFRQSAIHGLRFEQFTDSLGRKDYHMVACDADDDCPTLWARFYDIDDNRPFFSDRDGVKRYDLSEIGYERRNGYGWYTSDGLEVFERYATWSKKYGTKK